MQTNIYTPGPGVSSLMKNLFCTESVSCIAGRVILSRLGQIRFLPMCNGRVVNNIGPIELTVRLWGPRFANGIQCLKQWTHNWNLLYYQYTDTSYHNSAIQRMTNIMIPSFEVNSKISSLVWMGAWNVNVVLLTYIYIYHSYYNIFHTIIILICMAMVQHEMTQ